MRRPLALAAGLAFAAFPLIRPWGDKTGILSEMAQAFASPAWVIAHLSGAAAWTLLAGAAVAATWNSGTRRARTGAGLLCAGVAATLLYYGAETFSLHSLAAQATDLDALDSAQQAIRGGVVSSTLFALGLATSAVGTTLVALEARHRWASAPLTLLIALYLPQFFLAPGLRITHGLLLAAACALWALKGDSLSIDR